MKKIFLSCSVVCCVGSALWASSPKPKNESGESTTSAESLPINQEATEQSVLPDEPALVEPTPDPSRDFSNLQGMPKIDAVPSGPSQDDLRKLEEAFRVAKTEAEGDFALADIKIRAFAAPTEKEKRILLREYYNAISERIIKKSPELKTLTTSWNFMRQFRLSRRRTEPGSVSPIKPSDFVSSKKKGSPDSAGDEEQPGLLPGLGGR